MLPTYIALSVAIGIYMALVHHEKWVIAGFFGWAVLWPVVLLFLLGYAAVGRGR